MDSYTVIKNKVKLIDSNFDQISKIIDVIKKQDNKVNVMFAKNNAISL